MNSLRWILEVFTAGGTLVAVIGLIFGMRSFRRQMSAQTFLAYTDRYERIMASLPQEVRMMRFEASVDVYATDPKVESALLQYFNMCSEEFYLQANGYLDRRLWLIWEDEIKRTARGTLGRQVWARVIHEFDSYSEFQNWLAKAQEEQNESSRPLALTT